MDQSKLQYPYPFLILFPYFEQFILILVFLSDTGTSTAVCDLSSSQSTVSAFEVEDESIYGCSTTRYDLVNRRQIHVIELLSPRKNLGDSARGTAEVVVQKGRDLQVGNRDTLLVLVAQSPTLWRIRSTAIEGSLTVSVSILPCFMKVEFVSYSLHNKGSDYRYR